jgi:hypothetical protein
MEDFVTWSHASAIKKHVMEYNEMVSCFTVNFIPSSQNDFFFSEMTLIWMDDDPSLLCFISHSVHNSISLLNKRFHSIDAISLFHFVVNV